MTSAFSFHAMLAGLVFTSAFFSLPERPRETPAQKSCSGIAGVELAPVADPNDTRLIPADDCSPTVAELSKSAIQVSSAKAEEPFCGRPTPSTLPGSGGRSLSRSLQAQHIRLQI